MKITHSFKRGLFKHVWLKPSSTIYYMLHNFKVATTSLSLQKWSKGRDEKKKHIL